MCDCARTVWGRLLEEWFALIIGLEVSKPIGFYGSQHWLALTMRRATRAWALVYEVFKMASQYLGLD